MNRQIVLASRPKGMLNPSNFSIKEQSIPKPSNNEVLVQSLFISIDPYMRGRMNDEISYIEPFQINQPINGGVVARVVESKDPAFKPGDIVQGHLDWAEYSVTRGKNLEKVNPKLAPVSTAVGILGMPGMTAYFGLLENGNLKSGKTVVVSGAAGAVGSAVGQIAKIKGCRAIGIVGSDEKANYVKKELGFDAAINYKNKDYLEDLKKACQKGVDVYFDNVGGDITDNVLKLINKDARIIICGQISMYNLDKQDIGPRQFWRLLTKTATAKGFMVFDYEDRFPEGIKQMAQWIKEGKLKYREHVSNGIETAPKAFLGLFKGENIGKQLVKVAD